LPVIATDVGSLRNDIMEAKTGFLCRAKNPADLTRTIRIYFASDLDRNLEARRSQIRERVSQWPELVDKRGGDSGWVYRRVLGKINGPNRENKIINKNKLKMLLAMTIDSGTNQGGASRAAISRTYENDRITSVYSYFERRFRPVLLGHGLPFQRVGGECAGHSQ